MAESNGPVFRSDALAGRVAVVTGAAGGIGAATTRLLQSLGCSVALIDIDAAGMEVVATGSPRLLPLVCDIADEEQVDAAVEATLDMWGRCDVLVNNAMSVRFSRLEDVTADEWDRTIAANLRGYFLCTQRFGRPMLQSGSGAIVNVLSGAAVAPETMAGAYSAAKSGQAVLTMQTAVEWGPRGVRCNGVSPALIRTPVTEQFWRDPVISRSRTDLCPLRRSGDPAEVASVIAFLASDAASYVNGQIFFVDGGWSQTLIDQLPRPGIPTILTNQLESSDLETRSSAIDSHV